MLFGKDLRQAHIISHRGRYGAENRYCRASFIERFHRTLLEEHLRVQGRTKRYEALKEMQEDLDVYVVSYNTKRPHEGRGMKGGHPTRCSRKLCRGR